MLKDTTLWRELQTSSKLGHICGEQANYTGSLIPEHLTKKRTFFKKYCVF
jgi:hypothetical protein